MKKMIEIEYVGIKDVQEILEYAKAVMSRGHYINVSIGNVRELALVSVGITLGGFDEKKVMIIHIRFICQMTKTK